MNIRKQANLSMKEFAKEMRVDFPDVSPAFISAAERPETTGVQFTSQFKKVAQARFGRVKTEAKRAKPVHVTIWLTEEQRRFIGWAIPRYGVTSVTGFIGKLLDLEMQISSYKHKNGAACAGTQTTAMQISTNQL